MKEIWKSISNFEGFYEVSNFGRFKRLKRYSKNSRNNTYKKYDEKIFEPKHRNKNRYLNVKLTINGITTTHQAHRLVLLAFSKMPKDKTYVNHKNFNKHDNRLENLEWVSCKENINYTKIHGRLNPSKGNNHFRMKIKDEDIIVIKNMYKSGKYLQREIAELYNVNPNQISRIINNKRRNNLTGN